PRGEVSLRSKPGGGLCVGGSPIAPPGSAFSRAALPIKGRDGVCYERRSKQMRVEVGGETVTHRDKALHVVFAHAVDLTHAKPEREIVLCLRYRASRYLSARFQRAVPQAEIDVGFARLDAVLTCTTHDLRRRIEPH